MAETDELFEKFKQKLKEWSLIIFLGLLASLLANYFTYRLSISDGYKDGVVAGREAGYQDAYERTNDLIQTAVKRTVSLVSCLQRRW
jgi:hypothetical protein